jgi:hypothetical protein
MAARGASVVPDDRELGGAVGLGVTAFAHSVLAAGSEVL